jgi:Reverse transcriptase (RNA-dependent DNA polymerase)
MIGQMAKDLGLTTRFVAAFAQGASYAYKTYAIRKKDGGFRTIDHPSKQLKAMQRWLLSYLLDSLPIHPSAVAYRKKKSIFDNASLHAGSRYLLRMDCKDFFHSITDDDLKVLIASRPGTFSGWSPYETDLFCKLVCKGGRLTIGAPTSPTLSNAVCYDMDTQLSEISNKLDVTYSRYADDLFFSTKLPNVLSTLETTVVSTIANLTLPRALAINPAKTRHSSKGRTRRVTGITLGSDGKPYVGRAIKRKIRAMIHQVDTLDAKRRGSLAGLIAYAGGFDPDFVNSLITKYGHDTISKARTFPLA